jgi:hypothetical protein
VVIHGAAPGADTEAEHWALTSILVQVIPCPADWDGEGKAAGPKRNERMLRLLLALRDCRYEIAVVAYPLPGSRGTWDLVNRAKRAGVTVHVHEQPTEQETGDA